ncbi:MAG TPA: hypothetical protein VM580_33700 [Labilithrix sp.]|nr:hypothetical protein [Labilithrix sp.]
MIPPTRSAGDPANALGKARGAPRIEPAEERLQHDRGRGIHRALERYGVGLACHHHAQHLLGTGAMTAERSDVGEVRIAKGHAAGRHRRNQHQLA